MVISVNGTNTENISAESPLPLFHQPLVIDGKRLRKPVSRFEPSSSSASQVEHKVSSTGNGTALENFEKVKQEIGKLEIAELKKVHKLLFGHAGRQSLSKLIKKVGEFNGFPFAASSQEYKKRNIVLNQMPVEDITMINKILGLTVETTDQMIINIMEFLIEPKELVSSQKRKSSSDDNPTPKKKASDGSSQSESRHRLSESSDSDHDLSDPKVSNEKTVPQVLKPKKQVTFEDMVRQDQQINESRNNAHVSADPIVSKNPQTDK
ncbi:unnamed protein product [Caenorhabditis brenneri]